MSLIEGIGDEVIHFFLLFAAGVIALIAWWSTNISERPLLRTVLILERRSARHTTTDNQTLLSELRDTNEMASEGNETMEEEKTSQPNNDPSNQIQVDASEPSDNKEETQVSDPDFNQTQESNTQSQTIEDSGQNSEASEQSKESDSLQDVNENENENENGNENDDVRKHYTFLKSLIDQSSTSNEPEPNSTDEGKIRIRLKYLNDDQKLVEGKLQEQLGDFKKRHFSVELAGRKLIRLIFNGKVLQHDTKTLQNYGFFDNCVVHCLIHQPRTPPPSPNLNRSRSERRTRNETNHNWDLGNILFASLSFLLGLAWYGRYQYAQLYTATTTVALIGLTGMFTVSLIGMYMPDMDNVRA